MVSRAASAFAEEPSRPTIGYLSLRSPLPIDDAFVHELGRLGWIDGKDVVVERRFADGSEERLATLARELIESKVKLVVAVASSATQAAKQVTSSIPIIFINAGDPVGQEFVQSLAHPGTNITGLSFDASPDITAKQVELLARVVPNPKRLAVFWNSKSPFLATYLEVAKRSAAALNIDLQAVDMQPPETWDSKFAKMSSDQVEGVVILSDSFATFHRARLAELASKHRLPALYGHSQYTEAGGLMSYGSSFSDAFLRAPSFVDRVLRGDLPASLPVQQPTKFELILNLRTANAIGVEFPPAVVALADRVIE